MRNRYCKRQEADGEPLNLERNRGASPEAPHLYKIDGLYYLMIAEGGTEYGHMVTVSRSRHPYGPYEPCLHNPILSHRSRRSPIHATGHADLVQAQDGTWWAVFLGIRPVSYPMRHHLGRETYLAPVTWTADGWPSIGFEGRVEQVMDSPQRGMPMACKAVQRRFRSCLPRFGLGLLRNPLPGSWSLQEHPGYLRAGQPIVIERRGIPCFCRATIKPLFLQYIRALDFEPANEGKKRD